jgi:peroxiredoxin family protein
MINDTRLADIRDVLRDARRLLRADDKEKLLRASYMVSVELTHIAELMYKERTDKDAPLSADANFADLHNISAAAQHLFQACSLRMQMLGVSKFPNHR